MLFAQPLTRVLALRTTQISGQSADHAAGKLVTVTFATVNPVPVELPGVLDELVLAQRDRAEATATNGAESWLFPGRQPGRRVTRENVRHDLVAHGIHPGDARMAAMLQLAAEVPTPVLADLLGLSPTTATRWAALAGRSWGQYLALRRTTPAPGQPPGGQLPEP